MTDPNQHDVAEAMETAAVRVVTLVVAWNSVDCDPNLISLLEFIQLDPRLDGTIIGYAERDVELRVAP